MRFIQLRVNVEILKCCIFNPNSYVNLIKKRVLYNCPIKALYSSEAASLSLALGFPYKCLFFHPSHSLLFSSPCFSLFPLIKCFFPCVCRDIKLDCLAVAFLLNVVSIALLSQITGQRLEWQRRLLHHAPLIHFPMMLIEKVIFCLSGTISQLGI